MARLGALPPRVGRFDTRRLKAARKPSSSIYYTKEWRALVGRLIAERGRRCQLCGGPTAMIGKPVRIYADHIVELEDGGDPFAKSNIQLLDGRCHTTKTAAARASRR